MKNEGTMVTRTLLKVLIVILLLVGIGSLSLTVYFHTENPFLTARGLFKVLFTNAEYVEIQQYPQVMIAKPNTSLDAYMENRGYRRTEGYNMPFEGISEFTTGDFIEFVECSEHKFFSIWTWRE